MSKKTLISFIVPVYNSAQSLHCCIDNILARTSINLELLLIDDGSKDKSGQICDEYAARDSRVKVFHKENGGVSSARNLGLDNAKGEWVTFVDSDDILSPLDAMCLTNLDADMILFPLRMVNSEGESFCDSLMPLAVGEDTKENYLKAYLHFHVFNSACAKLIRRSSINDLRFDSSIKFGEDALFNLKLLNLIEKITVCNEVTYTYNLFEDYGAKYQMSIEASANTMNQIFRAYWMLKCRNRTFERNVFNCYRAICQNQWKDSPALWNKNAIVSSIYAQIKDSYPLVSRLKYKLSTTYMYRCLSNIRHKFCF